MLNKKGCSEGRHVDISIIVMTKYVNSLTPILWLDQFKYVWQKKHKPNSKSETSPHFVNKFSRKVLLYLSSGKHHRLVMRYAFFCIEARVSFVSLPIPFGLVRTLTDFIDTHKTTRSPKTAIFIAQNADAKPSSVIWFFWGHKHQITKNIVNTFGNELIKTIFSEKTFSLRTCDSLFVKNKNSKFFCNWIPR